MGTSRNEVHAKLSSDDEFRQKHCQLRSQLIADYKDCDQRGKRRRLSSRPTQETFDMSVKMRAELKPAGKTMIYTPEAYASTFGRPHTADGLQLQSIARADGTKLLGVLVRDGPGEGVFELQHSELTDKTWSQTVEGVGSSGDPQLADMRKDFMRVCASGRQDQAITESAPSRSALMSRPCPVSTAAAEPSEEAFDTEDMFFGLGSVLGPAVGSATPTARAAGKAVARPSAKSGKGGGAPKKSPKTLRGAGSAFEATTEALSAVDNPWRVDTGRLSQKLKSLAAVRAKLCTSKEAWAADKLQEVVTMHRELTFCLGLRNAYSLYEDKPTNGRRQGAFMKALEEVHRNTALKVPPSMVIFDRRQRALLLASNREWAKAWQLVSAKELMSLFDGVAPAVMKAQCSCFEDMWKAIEALPQAEAEESAHAMFNCILQLPREAFAEDVMTKLDDIARVVAAVACATSTVVACATSTVVACATSTALAGSSLDGSSKTSATTEDDMLRASLSNIERGQNELMYRVLHFGGTEFGHGLLMHVRELLDRHPAHVLVEVQRELVRLPEPPFENKSAYAASELLTMAEKLAGCGGGDLLHTASDMFNDALRRRCEWSVGSVLRVLQQCEVDEVDTRKLVTEVEVATTLAHRLGQSLVVLEACSSNDDPAALLTASGRDIRFLWASDVGTALQWLMEMRDVLDACASYEITLKEAVREEKNGEALDIGTMILRTATGEPKADETGLSIALQLLVGRFQKYQVHRCAGAEGATRLAKTLCLTAAGTAAVQVQPAGGVQVQPARGMVQPASAVAPASMVFSPDQAFLSARCDPLLAPLLAMRDVLHERQLALLDGVCGLRFLDVAPYIDDLPDPANAPTDDNRLAGMLELSGMLAGVNIIMDSTGKGSAETQCRALLGQLWCTVAELKRDVGSGTSVSIGLDEWETNNSAFAFLSTRLQALATQVGEFAVFWNRVAVRPGKNEETDAGAAVGATDAGEVAGEIDAGAAAGATDAGEVAGETDAGAAAGATDAGEVAGETDAGAAVGATDAGEVAGETDAGAALRLGGQCLLHDVKKSILDPVLHGPLCFAGAGPMLEDLLRPIVPDLESIVCQRDMDKVRTMLAENGDRSRLLPAAVAMAKEVQVMWSAGVLQLLTMLKQMGISDRGEAEAIARLQKCLEDLAAASDRINSYVAVLQSVKMMHSWHKAESRGRALTKAQKAAAIREFEKGLKAKSVTLPNAIVEVINSHKG